MSPIWRRDCRADMSSKELASLISDLDRESGLVELYDRLIADNPKAYRLDPDSRKLTKGQRILYTLALFDFDVNNGGVEQYLWNQPWMAFDTASYLDSLGLTDISNVLEPILAVVENRKGEWYQLRKATPSSEEDAIEAFRKSRRLVASSAFNDSYYGENGFGARLSQTIIDYVQTHPSEFIR